MPTRGTYNIETDNNGELVDNTANLDKLRKLFCDGAIINGNWGPGNDGDFDNGSWHILCHLAGGSGVLNTGSGRAWCGITHLSAADAYQASLVYRRNGSAVTVPLGGAEGSSLANGAQVLGYIEGSSIGHVAARGVNDPPNAFNGWPRQSFDQNPDNDMDGGTVWEHWCATRDIRSSSVIGSSVLQAYLTLVSRLGGRYIAAVARGRREHDHPTQLVALMKAGLLTCDDATWNISPEPIPQNAQDLLYEARPADALQAAELLPFTPGAQKYFMFQRRISRWSQTDDVRRDLGF
jgi:hypothetical protein